MYIYSIWDFFKELPVFLQKTNSILQAEYGVACDRLKQVWHDFYPILHDEYLILSIDIIIFGIFPLPQVKDLQASFTHLAVLFK